MVRGAVPAKQNKPSDFFGKLILVFLAQTTMGENIFYEPFTYIKVDLLRLKTFYCLLVDKSNVLKWKFFPTFLILSTCFPHT